MFETADTGLRTQHDGRARVIEQLRRDRRYVTHELYAEALDDAARPDSGTQQDAGCGDGPGAEHDAASADALDLSVRFDLDAAHATILEEHAPHEHTRNDRQALAGADLR